MWFSRDPLVCFSFCVLLSVFFYFSFPRLKRSVAFESLLARISGREATKSHYESIACRTGFGVMNTASRKINSSGNAVSAIITEEKPCGAANPKARDLSCIM